MRREEVVSSILECLEYQNVSPTSNLWQRASYNLEVVLKDFQNGGYFRNLHRYNIKLVKVVDDRILANFPNYSTVYYLPADFSSLETISDSFTVEFYSNSYWLCVKNNYCFNGCVDYSVKPDFQEFNWCDPTILHAVVSETARRIKAFDTGKDFEYISEMAMKNLASSRKIRTRRGGHLRTLGYKGRVI